MYDTLGNLRIQNHVHTLTKMQVHNGKNFRGRELSTHIYSSLKMIKYEAMKKVVEEEKARQNNTTSYYFMLQSSLPHLKASFSGFGS